MKTPIKLKTDYSGLSNPDLGTLATRTMHALIDNSNFPALIPSYLEYEEVAQDFLIKQGIASEGGSLLQREERDEARDALLVMMRRMVSYINNQTAISSVQLSTGFHPYSERKRGKAPRTPAWSRILDSDRPAEILLRFQSIKETYLYDLAIASELDENGTPIWEIVKTVSKAKGNFYAPVEDGVIYYFRVRCRNKHGVSDWSPASSLRARVAV